MEQQAWILRSILTQLEGQEAAGEEDPNNIAVEFLRLKSQSSMYRSDKTFSTKTAEMQENIKKNRYKDIVPFEHTRVKLTLTSSKKDSDYINASFVKGVFGSKAYIATQGPLPLTLVDFLRMLWEFNIQIIVMSCREFEMGKKKCELYWPQKQNEDFVCEPFRVYCDSEENKGDYLTRTLRLTYHNSSRILKQLHYMNWPDHGIPDTITPILDMLHEMRVYQAHEDVPVCLHCSAGCGRTGVLMVIDYTWNLLRNQMITSDFSIYNLVQDMRTQRPSVVQTKEQYLLVYRTIKELFRRYLDSMETQNSPREVPTAENGLSDQSQEFDLNSEQQREKESAFLLRYHTPLAPASEDFFTFGVEDMRWGQQQYQTLPDVQQNRYEGPNTSQTASTEVESAPETCDFPVQNFSPKDTMVDPKTVCLMVEDPYFDTQTSSPSSEEAPADESNWTQSPIFSAPVLLLNDQTMGPGSPVSVLPDDEVPPPLPERTPESFVLAVDTGPCERPVMIFPPKADATEDVSEGGPPSPAPPLPERTPESFELAADPTPVVKQQVVPLAVNLSIVGTSSEWSGNSAPEANTMNESSFMRSKSVRAKMTFSGEASLAQPIRDRTTEPFVPTTDDKIVFDSLDHEKRLMRPQSVGATPLLRVGLSSEWDGTSQSKNILDVVMNRSKSVRAKSSKEEPLSASKQLALLPEVAAQGGSAQRDLNRKSSLDTDRTGRKADKSNQKGMSRAKSLKFFRSRLRPDVPPPPPPAEARAKSPSPATSSAVFKLGFGNRFGKPKGPRTYPETWL
nr:tyrosine-protein phosphatase non-receptor type 22 isoform X1 [Nothobranchius furzeri]XP_054601689.1 tyrosine-protein phosphatase non-receptor type 22 isoform X1 [Nothobranchius furzeri]XP_054601690.1 tyrosine-protein phosphatase non-receptor type 22 isoform X1 [Nothobranchius furzeri]